MSQVHIHCTRLTGDLARQDCLSPEEQARAEAFAFPKDQARYRECHALLRQHLSQYTKLPPEAHAFRTGPFDKPELTNAPWHFNLSHSDELYAAAICHDHPIGIDIETGARQEDLLELAPHVCHPTERARLESTASEKQRQLFLCYRTAKEAFLKAIGCGFQQAPETVRVVGNPFSGTASVDAPIPAEGSASWRLHFLDIRDSHVLTVAVPESHQIRLVESPFDA